MGLAASQFYSANDTEKQTLVRRITPSSDQMADQQERWDALAEHLKSDLKERSSYTIRHWLQGSYKFRTQIRPAVKGQEFDIDLGIYFEWEGNRVSGTHSPLKLKQMVQSSLLDYSNKNQDDVVEVCKPKTRCCRIRFKGDFHIDIPAYHLNPTKDGRSLATQSDTWEDSDPKVLYKWFRDKFDDAGRARARRHIQYLKLWACLNENTGRPSSVLLTILVAEAVAVLDEGDLAADDDCLLAVLEAIKARLDSDPDVWNPVDDDENVIDRMSSTDFNSFQSALGDFCSIAKRALGASDLMTACDIWTEAFGHFFPAPEAEDILEETAGKTLSKSVALISFSPVVQVEAAPKANKLYKYTGTNGIGPIPKECSITFTLTNASQLPFGAQVSWIVRNQGQEAENTNDLGHVSATGTNATESSAYNGTHFMDCVVKLSGRVIGWQRIPVVVKGSIIPARNPLRKKPSYPR